MYQVEEEKMEYTTGQFVVFEIACLIPGLGLVLSIIASKVSKNQSFENYAKAHVILGILYVLFIVMALIGGSGR